MDIWNKIYTEMVTVNKWMKPREIKVVRGQYRRTQKDFAELIGVKYHTYKNWEIGHRIPCSPSMALLYIARDYPDIFLKNRETLVSKATAF